MSATAVSYTHLDVYKRQELRYPYYAHRLDGVLRNAWLWGITNGIDTDVFDPETDCALSANYSAADMSGKWVNKRALREEMGLSTDTDAPILGMVTRLAGHKGIDLSLIHISRWRSSPSWIPT